VTFCLVRRNEYSGVSRKVAGLSKSRGPCSERRREGGVRARGRSREAPPRVRRSALSSAGKVRDLHALLSPGAGSRTYACDDALWAEPDRRGDASTIASVAGGLTTKRTGGPYTCAGMPWSAARRSERQSSSRGLTHALQRHRPQRESTSKKVVRGPLHTRWNAAERDAKRRPTRQFEGPYTCAGTLWSSARSIWR
jgi:hypothetical protein